MDERIAKIKDFWDSRAREFGAAREATLRETYLRLLEIRTMKRMIRRYAPQRVLDVGCGNGYSTRLFARAFPNIMFIGTDYSEDMIRHAQADRVANCSFSVGDVLNPASLQGGPFDLILTQRCLQNLPDYALQRNAIENMLHLKNRNGHLLLMECSRNGVVQLNDMRDRWGRKPIEDIEPWHNRFMEDELLKSDFNAEVVCFSSTYMFLAKVIHPRLSALGYILPQLGNFGYDRLYIVK